MQKTRLGIKVGLLGAAIYFMGCYGGYLITMLLTGYVLLFEENQWLKKSAVKAVAIMILFSLIASVVYLLPDVISVIDGIAGMFNGHLYINFVSSFAAAVSSALNIVEKVLLICLGIKALTQGDVAVPIVDKLIDNYMG